MTHAQPPFSPYGKILGNYKAAQRDRLQLLIEAAEVGPVVSLPMLWKDFYLFNDAEIVGQILVDLSDVTIKALVLRRARRLLGDGLLTSENPLWRKQRKLVAHAFTPKRLPSYTEIMHKAALKAVEQWEPNSEFDIYQAMSSVTLDIVAKTLFSANVIDNAPRVAEALTIFTDFFSEELQRIVPPPRWWPSARNRAANHSMRVLDDIILNIIAQRRANPVKHGDLLDALLYAQDDEEGAQGMSDKQLRDECLTLFLAGHETTALAIAHTIYLLSQHPEAEARIANEVRNAVFHDPVTPRDLEQLTFTEAVLKESMRLYPPAWIMARELTADTTIGGYLIRKGSTLLVSQYITHRNPAYFKQPDQFMPERWLSPEIKTLPKFAYFPFGAGPRVCIGNHFAMTEAAIVLSTLLRKYHFTLVDGEKLVLQPSITLRAKHGLRMRIQEREAIGVSQQFEVLAK